MLSKCLFLIIATDNINLFEENFEEDATILVKGEKGFEQKNNNLLKLSFSKWNVQLVPHDMTKIANIQKDIITKQSFLSYNIVKLQIKYQSYTLVQPEDLLIEMKYLTITNQVQKLQNNHKINIFMNYSLGFGTGKHATTYLCLILLQELFTQKINNILDVGTGSGILAIAAAKIFKTKALAVDNDTLALETTKQFIQLNHLEALITVLFSHGFQNIIPQNFNLIMANILLNPLILMAENFNQFIAIDGYLILSGIQNNQSEKLKTSFQHKWSLIKEIQLNGWSALLLQKNIK